MKNNVLSNILLANNLTVILSYDNIEKIIQVKKYTKIASIKKKAIELFYPIKTDIYLQYKNINLDSFENQSIGLLIQNRTFIKIFVVAVPEVKIKTKIKLLSKSPISLYINGENNELSNKKPKLIISRNCSVLTKKHPFATEVNEKKHRSRITLTKINMNNLLHKSKDKTDSEFESDKYLSSENNNKNENYINTCADSSNSLNYVNNNINNSNSINNVINNLNKCYSSRNFISLPPINKTIDTSKSPNKIKLRLKKINEDKENKDKNSKNNLDENSKFDFLKSSADSPTQKYKGQNKIILSEVKKGNKNKSCKSIHYVGYSDKRPNYTDRVNINSHIILNQINKSKKNNYRNIDINDIIPNKDNKSSKKNNKSNEKDLKEKKEKDENIKNNNESILNKKIVSESETFSSEASELKDKIKPNSWEDCEECILGTSYYFCRDCDKFLCEKCQKKNHSDKQKHKLIYIEDDVLNSLDKYEEILTNKFNKGKEKLKKLNYNDQSIRTNLEIWKPKLNDYVLDLFDYAKEDYEKRERRNLPILENEEKEEDIFEKNNDEILYKFKQIKKDLKNEDNSCKDDIDAFELFAELNDKDYNIKNLIAEYNIKNKKESDIFDTKILFTDIENEINQVLFDLEEGLNDIYKDHMKIKKQKSGKKGTKKTKQKLRLV